MAQTEEFRVGEKVTMALVDGGSRIVKVDKVIGEGVYEVTGGGIVHKEQLYESDYFKPIFEEV